MSGNNCNICRVKQNKDPEGERGSVGVSTTKLKVVGWFGGPSIVY